MLLSQVTGPGSDELTSIILAKIKRHWLNRGIPPALLLNGGQHLVKAMLVLLFITEEYIFLIILKERKPMLCVASHFRRGRNCGGDGTMLT